MKMQMKIQHKSFLKVCIVPTILMILMGGQLVLHHQTVTRIILAPEEENNIKNYNNSNSNNVKVDHPSSATTNVSHEERDAPAVVLCPVNNDNATRVVFHVDLNSNKTRAAFHAHNNNIIKNIKSNKTNKESKRTTRTATLDEMMILLNAYQRNITREEMKQQIERARNKTMEKNAKRQKRATPPPSYSIGMLHMGKTGGSAIAALLRNACHMSVPKPCQDTPPPHERLLSKLVTHYYHIPMDRKRIGTMYSHDAWLLTTRDVYTRFVSALVYEHPANLKALGLLDPAQRQQPMDEVQLTTNALYHCFPNSLEQFGELVQWYMNSKNPALFFHFKRSKSKTMHRSYRVRPPRRATKDCTSKAYKLMTGYMPFNFGMHLRQGYQRTLDELKLVLGDKLIGSSSATELLPSSSSSSTRPKQHQYDTSGKDDSQAMDTTPSVPPHNNMTNSSSNSNITIDNSYIPLFVLRQEHLWQDWIDINVLLGESRHDMESFQPSSSSRNTSGMMVQPPVNKNQISAKSRWYFCLALQDEYRAYFHLLRLADNLADCPGTARITARTINTTTTTTSSSSIALNQAIAEALQSCPDLNLTHVLLPPPETYASSFGNHTPSWMKWKKAKNIER